MKQKIIILSVLVLATFVGCARGNKSTTMNSHDKVYHNGLSDINCSHLSDSQKSFASELSTTHRQVFCKVFTSTQRKKAMELVDKSKNLKSRGKSAFVAPLSPDQAVENIIKSQRTEKK